MTIQKTTDYDKFHVIPGNREIHEGNLKKITNSIKYKNMLDINPIVVREDGGIIDGQHRWMACKALGVPLYYLEQKKEFDPNDIIALNTNKRAWSLGDYVGHYAQYGNEKFKEVKSIMDKNNLTITQLLSFLGKDSGDAKASLKRGILNIDLDHLKNNILSNKEKIDEICAFIKERSMDNCYYLTTMSFRTALVMIMTSSGFDYDVFKNKIEVNLSKLRRCVSKQDYYHMLFSIYNFRNSNPLVLED